VRYLLDPANWDLSASGSIPNLLVQHLYITGVSLLIGLAIAVPIALLVARYRKLYLPTITAAGIIYTLPSLAVVGLLVPFTGLRPATIIIPLVAYAQVVLIRNIVAAVEAVDPTLVEVGRAMGMSSRQVQLRVVLPLALPVIVAGIRVTTVTTIGIASIGSLVGADNLGNLIFEGISLEPSGTDEIIAGAILIGALAIAADLLLLAVQAALSRGREVVATP
jgi:osmoprotectant transport system permease protein